MRFLLGALLSIIMSTAYADTRIDMSGFSHHLFNHDYTYKTETRTLNQDNWGFGIQHNDYRILAFRNSYYRNSVALMWTPEIYSTGLHGVLGAATGYKDTPKNLDVAPVVGIEYPIEFGNMYIIPGLMVPGVITLHAQWDFKW